MDLDETWQVGLRPETTKPCTFPAKSLYGFQREREKMGRRGVVFLWREQRTTSATFLGSNSAKRPMNTCPGGGLRHMVSYSRKVSIKRSSLPKTLFFRVPYLCSAYGSRGNVLRHLDSFHPLVDIPQIYLFWVTFAQGCTIFHLSVSESHHIGNGHTWMGTQ